MPNAIEITSPTADVAIVALIGEHDLNDYASLKLAFSKAAIEATHVVVDLSRCEFVDSTTISGLLAAQSVVVRDHGRFVVALPHEPNAVTRVADIMRLAELLPVYASVEAALASFQPHLSRPERRAQGPRAADEHVADMA